MTMGCQLRSHRGVDSLQWRAYKCPKRGRVLMNISSAIVYSNPHQADAVRGALSALPGIEIHTETGDGRFIITVEDTPQVTAADTIMRLHRLEGVLSAIMVYQYNDDDLT